MSDESFDDVAMTGMCRQHEGGLSVAIAGIRIGTPPKKIKDDLDVTTLDRIPPRRQPSIRDSGSFVLSR